MGESLWTATRENPAWLYIYDARRHVIGAYRCWAAEGAKAAGALVPVIYDTDPRNRKRTSLEDEALTPMRAGAGVKLWTWERDDKHAADVLISERLRLIRRRLWRLNDDIYKLSCERDALEFGEVRVDTR